MKLFLQIYYSLLFFILYRLAIQFINFVPALEPEYLFFAKPLEFFKPAIEIEPIIFLLSVFFCLFSVFKPYRVLRIITSFFVLVIFSILFSYENIHRNWHSWILSSILVCFFNEKQSLNSSTNFFILRFIQGMLLSHYFISGLWKLRLMLSSRFQFSLQEIAIDNVLQSLFEDIYPLLEILIRHSWLLGFGYFCVLIFQLTALLPVFLNKFFKLWGVLAILFHTSTGVSMSIYFPQTVLSILLFLIIAENMREYEIWRKNTISK